MSSDPIVVQVPEAPGVPAEHVALRRVAVTRPVEHPLGKVGSVALWNDRLVVTDIAAHELAIYDRAGRFVSTLGGAGTEPGAFGSRYLQAVRYGAQLAVLDQQNRRVVLVDGTGTAIGEQWPVPVLPGAAPGRLASTAQGTLMLASAVLGMDPTASPLPAHSIILSRYADSSWTECFTMAPAHHGNRVPAIGGRLLWTLDRAGHVVTSQRGEFAVQVHDDAGAVVRTLRRAWHPLAVTQADGPIMVGAFDTLMQRSAEVVGRKIPALALAGMRQLIDIPDSYPPFVTLLSDDVGRFWLELPAHATDIAQERPGQLADTNFGSGQWEVWDEAGHHLFDVRFPPPFVLMHVRGDVAAGVRIYAEGRPVVAVYQLSI